MDVIKIQSIANIVIILAKIIPLKYFELQSYTTVWFCDTGMFGLGPVAHLEVVISGKFNLGPYHREH